MEILVLIYTFAYSVGNLINCENDFRNMHKYIRMYVHTYIQTYIHGQEGRVNIPVDTRL